MNSWVFFLLVAELIWAVCTIIDKVVISKGHITNPFVFITANGFMNLFCFAIIPFLGISMLSVKQFSLVAIYGIFHTVSVILYYEAVSHDEISRVKVIDQMGPVLTYVFAFIFLGEFLTKYMLFGFILFITAGMFVSVKKSKDKTVISKAVPYLLIGMVFAAISSVSGKYIYNTTTFWNAFLWLRLSGLCALLVLLVPRIKEDFVNTVSKMPITYRKLMAFKMVIDFSAFTFSGYAITKGPIALMSAFAGALLPILVFFIAILLTRYYPNLLKETITKKVLLIKLFSILLVVIGIFLVNI